MTEGDDPGSMQIEVMARQNLHILVVGDAPDAGETLSLTYRLSKSGIPASCLTPWSGSGSCPGRPGPHVRDPLPSSTDIFQMLRRGRWQWLHVRVLGPDNSGTDWLARVMEASRRLGLYVSMNLALGQPSQTGPRQTSEPQPGVSQDPPLTHPQLVRARPLWAFATWVTLSGHDAQLLFPSMEAQQVETKLRMAGFRGLGVHIYTHSQEGEDGLEATYRRGLTGEAQWLKNTIESWV